MGFLFRSIVVIPVLVAIIAIVFGIVEQIQYVSLPKPDYLGPIRDRVPVDSNEFGRYTKPLPTIDYSSVSSSKLFNFLARKHWDFKSISSPRYFVVAAIANFNYIANAFVYVVDRTNRQKQFYQYAARSVLAQSIREQAKSSIDGCTHFNRSSSEYIRFCYNKDKKRYDMEANVPLNDGSQLSFDFQIEYSSVTDQSMVLLYPVDTNRPAYTHKIAALSAQGVMTIGNQKTENIRDGVSSVDWTFAYPERVCRWKWASLSTIGTNSSNNQPVTIGINLSDLIYNDNNGVSMEGAIWIAGKVYPAHQIVFKLPEAQYQTRDSWQIYSTGKSSAEIPNIQLTFQPWDSQEEHISVLLASGDFVQAFGIYNGTIELFGHTYAIENGFGVVENHYAKW